MKHFLILFCLLSSELQSQIAISAYTGGELIETKSRIGIHETGGGSGFRHPSYLLGATIELGLASWLGISYSFEASPKKTSYLWAWGSIYIPVSPGYKYTQLRHNAQIRMYLWPFLDIGCGLSQNVIWHPDLREGNIRLNNAKSFGPTIALRARYKNFLLEPAYYYGLNTYEVHFWETYSAQMITVRLGYRHVFAPIRKREKVRCPKF
jgi:hypothetical protein